MSILPLLTLVFFGPQAPAPDTEPDPARLREVLHDAMNPREQSQAALLLVRHRSPAAEDVIRRGLKQTDAPDVFLAVTAALRLAGDSRFNDELFAALSANGVGPRAAIRQAAAETLATLANRDIVSRLETIVQNKRNELALRQGALWILGRSGLQSAAGILIAQLDADNDAIHRTTAEALTELSGQSFGSDRERWKEWWGRTKDLPAERWLEQRLAFQGSRARRLEGELEKTRGQLVRVHQQLYSRLPLADRVGHIQAIAEQDDPALRALAVNWGLEVFAALAGSPTSSTLRDAMTRKAVAEVLFRLSHDAHPEVQRLAVLALGRVNESTAFDRLRVLAVEGKPQIRAAAARSLTQHARGNDTEAQARRKQVVPLLQKALNDPALEVVLEAAEDLGVLGVPEAAPVLLDLLVHSSEHVRQTVVHALERVADASVLEGLLAALDDPSVAVRFGLVGALGNAARATKGLTDEQRTRMLKRLQVVLAKDADPGVRSRAATVLGECGMPSVLPVLWQRVTASEDARVQDKAWAAMVEIVARSGKLDLLKEWDGVLAKEKQGAQRLRLLSEVHARWQKREDAATLQAPLAEILIPVQLEQGKWLAALPVVREVLTRTDEAGREKALRWLLEAGEQALRDGDAMMARRVVHEARTVLPRDSKLVEAFDRLEKKIQ